MSENKDKKKDKMPLGNVLKYNFLMLKKIWEMTPQYIVFMIVIGIVTGISNSIGTVLTYKLFNLIDMPDATFGKVSAYILLILAVNSAILIFNSWYYQYYQVVTDRKLQFRMHSELFRQALKMDLSCYDDPQFYNDYIWAMDESKNRAVQVLDDTSRIIKYLIGLSTLITLMMQVDVFVGLLLAIGSILNALLELAGSKIGFKLNERLKPYHRKNSYINRVYHLSDYAKELRISSAGDNLQSIYSEDVDAITEDRVKTGKKQFLLELAVNLVQCITQYLPMLILLIKLFKGTAQLGGFVASIGIIWDLNWLIYDLARNFTRMPENALYISKYLKFMSYEPKIAGGSLMAEPLESIELKNVSFAYSGKVEADKENEVSEKKKSLDGISLKIKRGEKVAIVGYNGAGKTTLTKLLMRLYDPDEGEIYYNGKNLKEYDIESLRSRIGTVFQDYKIFAATIAENVIGGECPEDMRDTVTDALTKSTFLDKLESLEKGMDTELTKEFYDDGVNLSGGESQKVAIARIFARPYELVIMDEPSSALDPAAEYELNHTILDYSEDKTVVFISHRLSTTRMADRILMFSEGRLIESGSHDELMEQNGKYAEMFRLQAEKYHMQ